MKIYDSPQNLVLLVNASQEEEESAIREELGMMGIRRLGLRVVRDGKEGYVSSGLGQRRIR
jgi:DNA excision repair protein ERCC-4